MITRQSDSRQMPPHFKTCTAIVPREPLILAHTTHHLESLMPTDELFNDTLFLKKLLYYIPGDDNSARSHEH